jgi:hypothetical protein
MLTASARRLKFANIAKANAKIANIKMIDAHQPACDSAETPSGSKSAERAKSIQEESMAGAKERRIAPRRTCVVPLRFRVLSGVVGVGVASAPPGSMTDPEMAPRWPAPGRIGIQDGQAANISERGIYFTSSMKLSVGDPLEMYFTMPSELTGRRAESVKCDARVVHVDSHANGSLGVGAVIEKLEPLEKVRNWAN